MLKKWTLWSLLLTILVTISSLSPAYAQTDTDSENKDRILTFIDSAYNQGDVSSIDTLFADDFTYHPGGFDKSFFLISILSLRAALPDMQATPLMAISDDNWVAVHMNIEGTFTDDLILPGSTPISPTNASLQFVTNMVFHFNDQGRVFEQWVTFDNLSYLAQLGMLDVNPNLWVGPLEPTVITTTNNLELQEQAILRYLAAFDRKDATILDAVLETPFASYNPFGSFDKSGQIADLSALFGAFPDLKITVTQVMNEGDYGAALYNMSGTFTANFVTAAGTFPANNRTLDLIRIDFFHFNDQAGIVEIREIYDGLDFMIQMGLLPPDIQQSP